MKKIVKFLSLLVAPVVFICSLLAGCKPGKPVDVDNGDIMQDIDVKPTQTPAYESYSRRAIEDYKSVAARHTVDGEIDYENPEVIQAAKTAAAKLYAYACYNERTLDKYVWFSDKRGSTDLGAMGAASVIKQDYYLRINESENSCGYRYYYTYKYANEYSGLVGGFKSAFEAARLRVTVDTDTMYRFEGNNMHLGRVNPTLGCNMVEGDWLTKNDDWGVKDIPMVKQEFIAPENIADDIIVQAQEYTAEKISNTTIHGNINILAENIIKYASIIEDSETGRYLIMLNIDTGVANTDRPSVDMLTKENGTSGDCTWKGKDEEGASGIAEDTGMKIIFSIWDNGLFNSYTIVERWTGKIVGFNGEAESSITVNYSYSDRDCDMSKNLAMLEEAKKTVNFDGE